MLELMFKGGVITWPLLACSIVALPLNAGTFASSAAPAAEGSHTPPFPMYKTGNACNKRQHKVTLYGFEAHPL